MSLWHALCLVVMEKPEVPGSLFSFSVSLHTYIAHEAVQCEQCLPSSILHWRLVSDVHSHGYGHLK